MTKDKDRKWTIDGELKAMDERLAGVEEELLKPRPEWSKVRRLLKQIGDKSLWALYKTKVLANDLQTRLDYVHGVLQHGWKTDMIGSRRRVGYCPECKSVVFSRNRKTRFHIWCGTKLSTIPTCPHCHEPLDLHESGRRPDFCHYCGQKISE